MGEVVPIADPALARLDREVEAAAHARNKAWAEFMGAKAALTDAIFRRAKYIEERVRRRGEV